MSMGRRKGERQESWIASTDLPPSPGNAFYEKLNRLLTEHGFDRFVENLCKSYYAENKGREPDHEDEGWSHAPASKG